VGSRYSLQKVLGYGSYSAVCLAVDNTTGERVSPLPVPCSLRDEMVVDSMLSMPCHAQRWMHGLFCSLSFHKQRSHLSSSPRVEAATQKSALTRQT